MTNEQHRKMLECAAKACGISQHPDGGCEHLFFIDGAYVLWNPLTNPADCAEMCAKLGIDVLWWFTKKKVTCFNGKIRCHQNWEDHDNSRLKAWMFAATMVAAKTQGYEP